MTIIKLRHRDYCQFFLIKKKEEVLKDLFGMLYGVCNSLMLDISVALTIGAWVRGNIPFVVGVLQNSCLSGWWLQALMEGQFPSQAPTKSTIS